MVTPPALSWPAGQRPAPDFVLRDQADRPVSLGAYRGRPVIVTFIDPLCRNLCPLEAQVLNQIERQMPASQRPVILAVSVDVYANARARTCSRTSASGIWFRSGTGPSAARRSWPRCGSATRSA